MSISQFFLAADFFGVRYVNGLMIWKRALYFYYTRAEIGSTHRSIDVFPIIHRLEWPIEGLVSSIRRNESGLIKPTTLPVLVEKWPADIFERTDRIPTLLIYQEPSFESPRVKKRKETRSFSKAGMEKILCPTVLRANNWRTKGRVYRCFLAVRTTATQ